MMKATRSPFSSPASRGGGLVALFCWLLLLLPAQALTRVLYLGDSFSKGAFGRNLDAQMRSAGLEVYTSVTGGASAYDWLPEFGATSTNIGYWEKTPKKEFRVTHLSRVPKIDEMVTRWRPNVVVIQGGTNMYSVLTSKRRPKEQNVAELERLLNRIGQIVTASGARLYWITPATAHPKRFPSELQAEMKSILTRVANRYGRTFDSYAVTHFTDPYPGTDGIHYGATEATAWSRLVAKDVITYSARLGGTSRRTIATKAADGDGGGASGSTRGRGFWDIFRRNRGTTPPPATPPTERRQASLTPPAPDAPPLSVRGADDAPAAAPADSPQGTPGAEAAIPALEVEVVLRQKSAIPNLGEVTYRSALGVFDYEVVAVNQGAYPAKSIRIAHLIVMNNQYTSINQRPLGSRLTLQVERLSKYPNLEKIQMVDDLDPAYDLDVFVPKL